jgi:ankyrin repeat protein
VVEFFLARGIEAGPAPLLLAAERGHSRIAELLVAYGVDVNAAGDDQLTALHLAIENGHNRLARWLLTKGARLDVFTASGLGRRDDVARILAADAALVRSEREDGSSPLHWAARSGQRAVAELLLARGADAAAQDHRGRTASQYAASQGHTRLANFLRSKE